MQKQKITITCEEMEQQLSRMNAKVANATDLAQAVGVLTTRCIGFLAEVQGGIEEIYLQIGEEG